MTIDISQFYQVFFDEAEELLAEMERLLLGVDVAAPDSEDLNAIFRTAHTRHLRPWRRRGYRWYRRSRTSF